MISLTYSGYVSRLSVLSFLSSPPFCASDYVASSRVQRISCEEALGRVMDDIAEFYGDEAKNRSTVVTKIVNGTFCAALYSEDDQWYRAVITKTYSPQQVEVHYIGICLIELSGE